MDDIEQRSTDEPGRQFSVTFMPDSVKLRLYSASQDAGLSMSQLVVDILDAHLPPLPDRRT